MELKQDFTEFIELLNNAGVRYLILGGYAVSFHVRPRATGDIDFFYAIAKDNCSKLEGVLQEFIGSSNITQELLGQSGKITMIGVPPNRIDLINNVSGVEFEEAWTNRVKGRYGNVSAWFISKSDLLRNKKSAKRIKDLPDIQWLEAE